MTTALTGLAGEHLVDCLMEGAGWHLISPLGGGQRGSDGVWQHAVTGRRLALAIRTRSASSSFQDLTPTAARHLELRAEEYGAGALFVAVTIVDTDLDFRKGSCSAGSIIAAGACTVAEMARIAAEGRAAYASVPYQRGDRAGQPRPESGCLYAIDMADLTPLGDVLAAAS